MATQYSLTVQNNSSNAGNICVYATAPDSQVQLNLKSLAWFSKAVNPNTSVTFDWAVDYAFTWCEVGKLVPGVKFKASQILRADPSDSNNNTAFYEMKNGAFNFGDKSLATTVPHGCLGITTSDNIPNKTSSIGIALGGKAALVTEASVNYQYTFIPHLKYWVAFGTFTQGEVLDLNSMVKKVYEVTFPLNIYDKTIILNPDNTWSEGVTLRAYNERIIADKLKEIAQC